MAHKKGGGTSRNGRDSNGQRRGVKVFANTTIPAGSIIVRQKGNKFWPGVNVGQGRDFTLYATSSGMVNFSWGAKGRRMVNVASDN